jgi:hypothetical protein
MIVAKGDHLSRIVHFGDQQVFYGATTYPCLLFLSKSPVQQFHFTRVDDLDSWPVKEGGREGSIKTRFLSTTAWNFVVGKEAVLFEKLNQFTLRLFAISL